MLLAWPAASARYLGTDVLGDLAPASQLGGGSLVDRYPLSAYSLDYHVDVGVTDMDGVPATIAHWAAAQLWNLTSFLIKTVIDLFTWAFSLDLLGGTDGGGALAPIADAISSIYENVLGETWMVAAIVAAGIWGIWKALVQRRYTETLGALGVSVAFVLIALFFVYQPQQTIGEASRWTNTALAGVPVGREPRHDRPAAGRQAPGRRSAVRHAGLRAVGGARVRRAQPLRRHRPQATTTASRRRSGRTTRAAPSAATTCSAGRDGHGGYAPRFLRQPAGSDERDREYEVLRDGELPSRRRASSPAIRSTRPTRRRSTSSSRAARFSG